MVSSTTTESNHDPFSELFFDLEKNRDAIWRGMASLINEIAQSHRVRTSDQLAEVKGDALTWAMEKIPQYDPSRRSAHAYFGSIIRRKMRDDTERLNRRHHDAIDPEFNMHD